MAGRASLSFLGQEDIYLSSDPEVTYFVEKFQGSTLFSSRVIRLQFPGDNKVTFGSERSLLIPRAGDLITNMYLKILGPSFSPGTLVLDSVATLMIQYVELYIGSELVERIYGEYLEIMFDITISEGKQKALSRLVGKNLTSLTLQNESYTVPLQFSVLNKGLPLCAFKEDVTFKIVWNPSILFTSPPENNTTPFSAYLDTEYTYISSQEIDFINSKPQTYLIEQIQRQEFFCPQNLNQIQCFTDFLNPVKELFVVVQNDSVNGYDYTIDGTNEQLDNLTLYFNTTERISKDVGSPVCLRIIQPLEYHTRIPDRIFYMYSFSIDPENDNFAGSVNMSQIKNQIFQFTLNPNTANRNIRIYAVSYNFLYVNNSSAHVIFSNFH